MMKTVLIAATLLLTFLILTTGIAAAQNSWHYPLEIKAGLSSNFGEFRGQRVHTGVDLRTNGITGYKVYAIDDGTIVRLSVKKLGFGNALYIQHSNGLMSVYGHLDRFEEQSLGLRTLVKQYQRQRNTKYPGNIFLKKPVKRGQLIGYSGETGYGLPHLHFEVRRGGATPIDPFEHGFTYEDKIPPVIESLIIEPLGAQSWLESDHVAREYRTTYQQGKYLIPHIPKVHGKLRFTVSAYDQIGAQNRCNVDQIDLYIAQSGVDQLDLYVDREPFFHNQFDQVTYDTNHRGGLVYDFNLTRLSNPTQYYYRLYNLAPSQFPYRQVFAKHGGVWDTTTAQPGRHTLVVEIRDVAGNLQIAQMQVEVVQQPSLPLTYPPLESGWKADVRDFQEFLEIVCQSADPLQETPAVRITQPHHDPEILQLTPRGPNLFSGIYPLSSRKPGVLTLELTALPQTGQPFQQTWQFPVNPISATRGGTVKYGSQASMTFPPGALYQDIFANIFPAASYKITAGLPLIGDAYDFRPAGCPLEKKGTIRISYPPNAPKPQQLGIFWWDHIKQRWYFMDDNRDSRTHSLSTAIIYPSVYAVLRDTLNPVISDLVPENGSTISTTHSTISAIIKDVGKGVAEPSIRMTLDDKTLDGEYDPDRDKFAYTVPTPLAPGTHTLTVQAADRAGNPATTATSTFRVQ
ncbi:peptidoglycan DD-metalloendopeptidase family protein [candidate division KSB3 bacterium]|uniref:Peptidoglycan DD-metalloendopeptidase family protein n=1 Tax=candidate division KSB3 bacterium TaxID=2044937 RepID=A0A9D5JWF4_9BACT|nr:peptidoglycan DD-metalloendopeptidase family protein [candidate division KSB3 bacterium]MBD3325539.1 peptidoglycan DD-metalloendopeptidase family protein [candidate division KSB3 bacterium]